MKTIDIPFNKFLGLQEADGSEHLITLNEDKKYENHLGTVHASAQFALAEACSGEYLLKRFAERASRILPVVRRVETKFKKPARGPLYAQASLNDELAQKAIIRLETKGRAVFPVSVEIKDKERNTTMVATVEWFVQTITEEQ